ncbi:MAG: response regulator transcription factor [Defluviitaleaceae bacterium]|nr:response regulator transcription factor [Defluviitaleaceae bacterium]MCL2263081.1 response regulator transcription factor [Defluviitaleaceae bacterium]
MDGTILLVDNDPYQNNAIRCEFSWREYSVLTATSFGEARAMLKKSDPDIILMEAVLPDGDGFDFYKEIRGRTSASIVFLTAKSDDTDMIKGLKLGADEYIKKPFDKEVMAARVDAVMRWRKKLGSRIHSAYEPTGSG